MFDIAEIIVEIVYFYLIPASLIFFGVSLFRYKYAKYQNKLTSDTYSPEQIKSRKKLLIVSTLIAGIMAVVLTALILGLLIMAVVIM